MGMFDGVLVSCPKCGAACIIQSKGGERMLWLYHLQRAPLRVVAGADSPVGCPKCSATFRVAVKWTVHTEIADAPRRYVAASADDPQEVEFYTEAPEP